MTSKLKAISSVEIEESGCPYCGNASYRKELSGKFAQLCICKGCDDAFIMTQPGVDETHDFRDGTIKVERHPRLGLPARNPLVLLTTTTSISPN